MFLMDWKRAHHPRLARSKRQDAQHTHTASRGVDDAVPALQRGFGPASRIGAILARPQNSLFVAARMSQALLVATLDPMLPCDELAEPAPSWRRGPRAATALALNRSFSLLRSGRPLSIATCADRSSRDGSGPLAKKIPNHGLQLGIHPKNKSCVVR